MSNRMTDCAPLEANAISHAWVRPVVHEELGAPISGQTAVRYLRFGRKVCVQALDIAPMQAARWVPATPTHPAHLNVWALDEQGAWRRVGGYDLPCVPEIAGEGLHQSMTIAEMEAVLRKGFSVKHRVELPKVETVALRVECDREHAVWPNHGECNGAPYMVPFAVLNNLTALGQALGEAQLIPAYHRPLVKGDLTPAPPAGMTVELTPWRVDFCSERFAVGFSLIRPELLHLGWDGTGSGRAGENRLHVRARSIFQPFHGQSGPMLRNFRGDFNAANWTGEVEVRGHRVIYRKVTCGQGVTIDATFTVGADGLRLDLVQQADATLPVVEYEAWRLNWDCGQAMTAASAVPTLASGRNGHVELPMFWAGDGNGVLRTELLAGEAWLQCESYKANQAVTGGLIPGRRPGLEESLVIPAGRHECAWRLSVAAYAPCAGGAATSLPPALRRHWGSVFSCYRPEYGGFSNNAISVNCHVNQGHPAELVAHTVKLERGPDPVDLYRFTIERALLGGGGYGFYRNLYCDSDPILLSGAGRIFQARPDRAFLQRVRTGLVAATRRVLGTLDEQGLACCRDLSGDSGSFRWSSNAMDVVGFGHYDGYVNALTYRGLRNAAALLREVGETELAARCAGAAVKLRAAFAPQLLNPATGWVAGWRSRDGQLHDPAFPWINSVAIAYGLLDHDQAVNALTGLEKLRHEVGADHAQFGLPFNLLPMDERDHMLPQPHMMGRWRSTYENYTDGSMGACFAGTYLRALSIYGLRDAARAICADLEEGYTRGHFNSGNGGGVEFYRWDGIPTGYEGTFVASWHALYAIAIERGVIQPTDPEWWPA